MRSCRAAWRAQSVALAATERSLAQWRVHVEAMNRLVAGEITLDQANQFWARTRVGAAARVARADSATDAYAGLAPKCSEAAAPSRAARAPVALERCRAAIEARDRVVTAGVAAVTTWRHHMMDMEMLRTGRMSAAQATRMWLMNWHKGVRELRRFAHLRRATAHSHGC